MRMHIPCLIAVTVSMLPGGCTTSPAARMDATPAAMISGDESVHCLLPSRVQKLGGIVYPARRELVFESAKRCELRGGEYTVYDRSTAESSAEFYRPLAEAGDPEAQYNLALVYESLFAEPDYPEAARWYSMAAEQNHAGALKNLSYLHEMGLGVAKDPVLAVNLLRRAGGITDDLVLASELDSALTAAEVRIKELTHRLEEQNTQSAALSRALATANEEIAGRRADLTRTQRDMAALQTELASARTPPPASAPNADPGRIRELEETLATYQRQVADQQMDIAAFESDIEVYRARLAASERKASLQEERLSAQLAKVKTTGDQELEGVLGQIAERDAEIARLTGSLSELKAQHDQALSEQERLLTALDRARAQASAEQAGGSAELDRLQTEVDRRSMLISEQSQQILALEQEVQNARSAMDVLRTDNDERAREAATLNARLVVLEKELIETRTQLEAARARLASEQSERQTLLSSVENLRSQIDRNSNATDEQLAELRRWLAEQDRALAEKDARIAALTEEVDTREQALAAAREQRETQLLAVRSARQARPEFPTAPRIDMRSSGRMYGLLIGNDNYSNMPRLQTAAAGARALGQVLRDKYGFTTTVLVDANRQQMMDAFLRLRQQLTEDDYLLIYYGGHGDMDPSDEAVSYWLPVDARDDPITLATDGIKSTWITNEIRAMNARHVMIIADSCYAGAMVRPPRVSVPRTKLDSRRLEYMLDRRSRTVLTSGANSPVLDRSLDSEHSMFTRALLDLLEENTGVVYGEWLHAALVDLVRFDAEQLDFEQVPQFSEIADANHGNGQFVLINRG